MHAIAPVRTGAFRRPSRRQGATELAGMILAEQQNLADAATSGRWPAPPAVTEVQLSYASAAGEGHEAAWRVHGAWLGSIQAVGRVPTALLLPLFDSLARQREELLDVAGAGGSPRPLVHWPSKVKSHVRR